MDEFETKAAHDVLERIAGQVENLPTISDAELALVRMHQQYSGAMIATALNGRLGGDLDAVNARVAEAEKLDAHDLGARASRGIDRLKRDKAATVAQLAALLVTCRAEHFEMDREVERRSGQTGTIQ